METNKKVDQYILKKSAWAKELAFLRETMLSIELEEELKWGAPVYVDNGKNVVGLAAFKNYVCIWFFQGALLKDEKNKLYNAQEGKAIAMRQWRFANFEDIIGNILLVESYVKKATQNMREGKMIKPATKKPIETPTELQEALDGNAKLKTQFENLSVSKQREFTVYITDAKRPQTKQTRL